MISAKQTNFIYFSELISTTEKLQPFWKELKQILETENISYAFLEKTSSVWCKDYMPFQTDVKKFIQFTYDPDFLKTPELADYKTNPSRVTKQLSLGTIELSDLIIDIGNLVNCEKKIAVCDKIFKDNSFIKDREVIIQKLKEILGCKEVLVLPTNKDDIFGQASTMMRFMNDNSLLVTTNPEQNKNWTKQLDKTLQDACYHLIDFPGLYRKRSTKTSPFTAIGCYINFIHVGNKIIFPQFDIDLDTIALNTVRKIYPMSKVFPINCCELAEDGGVLNSLAWNIKI
ncbi:MAG: agmatine deiminase family protein [Bacteroidales bacterium]|nr:agmatine deiminase family protein [Bacteroidales bacterium]